MVYAILVALFHLLWKSLFETRKSSNKLYLLAFCFVCLQLETVDVNEASVCTSTYAPQLEHYRCKWQNFCCFRLATSNDLNSAIFTKTIMCYCIRRCTDEYEKKKDSRIFFPFFLYIAFVHKQPYIMWLRRERRLVSICQHKSLHKTEPTIQQNC